MLSLQIAVTNLGPQIRTVSLWNQTHKYVFNYRDSTLTMDDLMAQLPESFQLQVGQTHVFEFPFPDNTVAFDLLLSSDAERKPSAEIVDFKKVPFLPLPCFFLRVFCTERE